MYSVGVDLKELETYYLYGKGYVWGMPFLPTSFSLDRLCYKLVILQTCYFIMHFSSRGSIYFISGNNVPFIPQENSLFELC